MINKDVEWVNKINSDDQAAWERFVTAFSPWVLYKARVWCGYDCSLPGDTSCCLTALSKSLKSNTMPPRGHDCDKGMDVYLWIFGELRKRVGKFSARNGSSLATFVWSVLNSQNLYIDWLRDKYGRII